MEEQEEGREYKNKERKKNDIKKKNDTTVISLRKITAELSRLLAVNSSLHVTFIPLMVSPPSLLIHMYLLHFHLQYEKQYQKHLEIDVYLYLSLYILLPSLWSLGTKEKKLEGKNFTLWLSQEHGGGQTMWGKAKENKRRPNKIMKVQRLPRCP